MWKDVLLSKPVIISLLFSIIFMAIVFFSTKDGSHFLSEELDLQVPLRLEPGTSTVRSTKEPDTFHRDVQDATALVEKDEVHQPLDPKITSEELEEVVNREEDMMSASNDRDVDSTRKSVFNPEDFDGGVGMIITPEMLKDYQKREDKNGLVYPVEMAEGYVAEGRKLGGHGSFVVAIHRHTETISVMSQDGELLPPELAQVVFEEDLPGFRMSYDRSEYPGGDDVPTRLFFGVNADTGEYEFRQLD